MTQSSKHEQGVLFRHKEKYIQQQNSSLLTLTLKYCLLPAGSLFRFSSCWFPFILHVLPIKYLYSLISWLLFISKMPNHTQCTWEASLIDTESASTNTASKSDSTLHNRTRHPTSVFHNISSINKEHMKQALFSDSKQPWELVTSSATKGLKQVWFSFTTLTPSGC